MTQYLRIASQGVFIFYGTKKMLLRCVFSYFLQLLFYICSLQEVQPRLMNSSWTKITETRPGQRLMKLMYSFYFVFRWWRDAFASFTGAARSNARCVLTSSKCNTVNDSFLVLPSSVWWSRQCTAPSSAKSSVQRCHQLT